MAPFVSEEEGGIIVQGTSMESKSVKTPRIRLKKPLSGKQLLTERTAGQNFYAAGPKDIQDAKNQKIMLEFLDLKERVSIREEWMCAQALTGKMEIPGKKGVLQKIDYRMPISNKIVLGAGDRWNEENGDPKGVIQSASDMMVDSGYTPDLIIGGTEAIKYLQTKTEKNEWVPSNFLHSGNPNWKASKNYQGEFGGLDVYRYGRIIKDSAGTSFKLIDPEKIYMIDTSARFSIEFGIILDLEHEASIVGEMFSKSWLEKDPSVLWNLIESRPLPVPWEPEAIVEITVL